MKDKLSKLISQEDRRRPFTDQELAAALGTTREEVTLLRNEAGIPNSRERLKMHLRSVVNELLKNQEDYSIRALTGELKAQGYKLSRHVVKDLVGELAESGEAAAVEPIFRPVEGRSDNEQEPGAFTNLIGWQGSLRTQIQQAKAAVVYPPKGLHTLILGESGVGKSELAEAMYRYSVEVGQREKGSPFVVFNCADYAENPQLLISQLFGHIRGAFTGAAEDKTGLVQKADGGILFLDEVHRLPPEGQEILYAIIDRGVYRRLGETENQHYVNLMLIAATSEKLESSLILPFRRRIPMVIEIPPLNSRPLTERLELVHHFFKQEASRIGKKIVVRGNVIKALLSGDKPGNVGQLKSDIQVACARGFLSHFTLSRGDEVVVTVNELSSSSKGSFIQDKEIRELDTLITQDAVFYPRNLDSEKGAILADNIYTLPAQIYEYIEREVSRCRREGLSLEETNQRISKDLEKEFNRFIAHTRKIKHALSKRDLERIIGLEITETVSQMVDIARNELGAIDSDQLFFYLAIHLNTTLKRILSGKPIYNPRLEQIKKEHQREYLTAHKMSNIVKRNYRITLPEEEIGFIALYLSAFLSNNAQDEGNVAVVVLSHGRSATEMVRVVNNMLKVNHAHGLGMELTESPEHFLQRVITLCKQVHRGKGILLLVDMGSLLTFSEIIEQQLGIKVRAVDRVDLVMILEATRWAIYSSATLDEIAAAITQSKRIFFTAPDRSSKEAVVLAVCLSGYGVSEKIKDYLEPRLKEFNVAVITAGLMDEEELSQKVDRWRHKQRVIAAVGTIDPEINGLPFIPFYDVINGEGMEHLKLLLGRGDILAVNSGKITGPEVIVVKQRWPDRDTVIRELGHKLLQQGYVKPGFIESVFEREEMGPTCLQGGLAIPHADPQYVIKAGVAVATLAEPVEWWGLQVDLVFLLALRVTDRQLFESLLKVINDERKTQIIRSANSAREIEEEINLAINQPYQSRKVWLK